MSGFAGIVNLDGAPVDSRLLENLTEYLRFRGPDAIGVWHNGPVGFGHTLLRTTDESENEKQPFSLDGSVWIVADARVDGREDLIAKMAPAEERQVLAARPDVELLLRAYLKWGEACVDHVIGDFSFAVWDAPRRTLFCARDHFGVKLFYYAKIGNTLIFSNTLNCIRRHPDVPSTLNELAIADFLLADWNRDVARTSFEHIHRIPPAHTLSVARSLPEPRCYWRLTPREVRYQRASDYVERCRELLAQSVADRLRTRNVGVWMSGGLDSPLVAGYAKRALAARYADFDLRAYTVVYDWIIRDTERPFAQAAADGIGIPIHFLIGDEYKPYGRPPFAWPQPCHDPLEWIELDQHSEVQERSRVVLSGYGGDPLLTSSSLYAFEMLGSGKIGELIWGSAQFLLHQHTLPRYGIRTALRRLRKVEPPRPPLPNWINPSFAKRLDLETRWKTLRDESLLQTPGRESACHSATHPVWQYRFESLDPGVTRFQIESRHPFFDVRLSQFLVGLPVLPWTMKKCIIRACGEGILPERVRLRPKTPLRGSPVFEHARRGAYTDWIGESGLSPQLAEYVDCGRVPSSVAGSASEFWVNLRPVSLNNWLRTYNE